MKQGLLVIDVQNDYFAKGKMELVLPEAALKKINQLESYFLRHNLPIIYIQHIKHEKNAAFFEADTTGAALHSDLQNKPSSIIIEKHFPNSFYQTNLETELHRVGVEQLVICGMMTHMCVDSTTRASKELEFDPLLISDATATKNLTINKKIVLAKDVQNAFLASLTNFATLKTTTEFISQV
ncbi:hypothetical protein FC19_GL001792 [Liquorilactobacillus aquaticus DSM 21051]|uniref:Isochorismatase-like domain-containing protein n=1 Tax=Liquorilactobacillus aquaticus DSM 21051 TaxID=1423725 RepID=A0A0R2D526_9LACO|nr:cysteine hydrolase family protein [Liquorilactobacillus aquaticus]KRM95478.1 hypothetical protein FC19_GL001792 [Liquorilactobacillus aquaticus DSM 21051]